MAHYVYTETGNPVEPGVRVYTIPPGVADSMPQGGWVTEDGKRVTEMKDGADDVGIAPPQNPSAYTTVDLIAEIREQLNRIETKVSGG